MSANPLLKLHEFGQSIWLDFIRRGMLVSGEFKSLIDKDGVLGVTSNPSIFEKAIAGTHDYDDTIRSATLAGKTSKEIYELLTVVDIQSAADLFLQAFEKTRGIDGFASLEVSPHLAYDTSGTIDEARLLWKKVARPNVLIKVPGTLQGLPAIRQLIGDGINVNVTLLFGLERYAEVIEAYISGLEDRVRAGKPLMGVTSVASFFLSRIDTAVDSLLPASSPLRGQTAISSAKAAYQKYRKSFSDERFSVLAKQGAKTQRLLWASTSTKSPSDSDVKYIEALIGPETINTVPLETLNAYRDHGKPENRLEQNEALAKQNFEHLLQTKIDLKKVTQNLEADGVHKFSVAFDQLMTALEVKRKSILNESEEKFNVSLANCEDRVQKQIKELEAKSCVQRIWRKDASLWKRDSAAQEQIRNSLGWLHIPEKMEESLADEIHSFVREIKAAGFQHVLHMGMGGSSLAPLVFARTFSSEDGLPLTVLDTTDPTTIRNVENSIPIEKTLFIVASKSGTTAEPLAFKDYFFDRLRPIKGDKTGENFIAITDPGTPLARQAVEQGFRNVFLNAPDIGGRYSALTYFGLIPAALLGVDIHKILKRALQSLSASATCVPGHEAPSLVLGAALGQMALQRKDKVTLLVDESLSAFGEALGLWLEQLLAESTGKEGKGIIPVAGEPLGETSAYGSDRFFVYLTSKTSKVPQGNEPAARTVAALKQAGHPVATITISNHDDIGREFFQWEFATAVAGSVLGINPFDQPNVQESKDNTDRLLSLASSKISTEAQIPPEPSLSFHADFKAVSALEYVAQFIRKVHGGDYFAFMVFLPEAANTSTILQRIRAAIRDKLKIATTLGYGPRFLHSTGQLHKGGPDSGLYLQLTGNVFDLPIPGRPYSFEFFKQAQAQGDLEALRKHGRRAMRIHLGFEIEKGLLELERLVNRVLGEL